MTTATAEPEITAAEHATRLAAVRHRMAEAGLDALLVSDPANLYYLTGYNAWSFYVPQLLLVPAAGEVVFYARAMDAGGAHRICSLPPEQIVGYPENLVHRPDVHPFDWVAERLRDRLTISAGTTIGTESDAHFYSPRAHQALQAGLAPAALVDSRELVNWVRSVKSEAEVALMRRAAVVTAAAMRAAIEVIDVGVAQYEAAAEISRAQALGDGETWGDYPAITPMLPTGESADTPHLTWSERRFADGEAVVIELAGVHRRYHVPLARTIMLGTPAPEVARLVEPVAEGMETVLAGLRAGARVGDVGQSWNDVLARAGLSKPSRLGYSIGIGFPPDWGERTISIRPEDDTVLAGGMTLHVICGMWMEGYGYELSESVLVTEGGAQPFTNLPRGLLRPRRAA